MGERIDVIVPCYKYGHFLKQCVESVLSQAEVDLRVLILDDASPDSTPAVGAALASVDRRVTYHRHSTNKGHIATYNEGIAWATGDYFLLLSADDYLVPGALARATSLMKERPSLGLTFGNALHLKPDGSFERVYPLGNKIAIGSRILTGAAFIRASGARNIVPTPTAIVRTNLQKLVGGYDPDLPHSGDMEMWLRFASRADVGFVNDDQAVYRLHGSNMSLGYFAESFIPDLLQRKMVLDKLACQKGSSSEGMNDILAILSKDLALEALRYASSAFNKSDSPSVETLKGFATGLSPDARRSLPWVKLMVKEAIGLTTWRAMSTFRRGLFPPASS